MRWTVPLHVVLPIGLWWLMQINTMLAAQVFLGVHIGFLIVLLVTIAWWWAHSGDLIALLFINHMVSFAVAVFLPW